MTIGQLKATIAGYLGESVSEYSKGSGATAVDLLLVALNNARKKAERLHDFNAALVYAYLSIPAGSEVALSDAALVSNDATVSIRAVKQYYMYLNSIARPVRSIPKSLLSKLQKQYEYREPYPDPLANRYLSDNDEPFFSIGQPYVVTNGTSISFHPAQTNALVIRMDAYKWFDDYTADSNTDWFTIHAADYLMWQGIVEANHLTESFAYRQDGNLPPPEKHAERCLQEIIFNDSMEHETARDYERF